MRSIAFVHAVLAFITTASAIKHRNVTFWYSPDAYGGSDIDTIVDLMARHNNTVNSVILECGHSINSSSPRGMNCAEPYEQLTGSCKIGADTCLKTAQGLNAANIHVELLVGGPDGAGTGPDSNFFPAAFTRRNASLFAKTMVEIAKRFNAIGVNIDSEPDQGGKTTILTPPFVNFLETVKPVLNAAGLRLTADVAQWCKMTSEYKSLAPHADRLLNMEQYNANSMQGWLKGDAYGGYYEKFVGNSTGIPVDKCAPGLGIWGATCGKDTAGKPVPCWSTKEESAMPRIDRMIADNVEEIALFRLLAIKGAHWPASWWWPALDKFAATPLLP